MSFCRAGVGLLLFLSSQAFAGVVLPTGNFSCGLLTTPFFGSTVLSNCTPTGSAGAITGDPDITGVSLGMGVPVVWSVAGSQAGGTEIAIPDPTPGGLENQGNALIMETSGTVGGSGFFNGYMPLHYDFTISPLAPVSCVSTTPCDMNISWSLALLLNGPAVTGGEVALPIVFGSGTGHFTGDALLPSSPNPLITVLPMTLTSGLDVTVRAILSLNANSFPNDATASFNVIVPAGASFDFQGPSAAVPEPASMGLLGAALLFFGYRRFTARA
jgi:hypothetical protein